MEKKRWSFDGVDEKSVEYAVLDYFRAQGWEGYFTEHDYYWFCIGIIMGYPNWRKRRPRHIHSLSALFFEGYDGWSSNWIRMPLSPGYSPSSGFEAETAAASTCEDITLAAQSGDPAAMASTSSL